MFWQEAILTDSKYISKDIKSITVALEKPFAFKAGQYCNIKVLNREGDVAVRSYSIANAPNILKENQVLYWKEDEELELAVKILPDGEVSTLLDGLSEGNKIEIMGPIGRHFIIDFVKKTEEQKQKVLGLKEGKSFTLIGGGSGVVPLVSMLRLIDLLGNPYEAQALFSFSKYVDIPWKVELESLQKKENIEINIHLTKEKSERIGSYFGRIDENALKDKIDQDSIFYLCGKNIFVDTIYKSLLNSGVESNKIKSERYG
jgi:ferredoxin-NADP reductase